LDSTENSHEERHDTSPPAEETAGSGGGSGSDDRPDHLKWKGRSATFMQSNEHSKDRQGVWDASGLEGAAKTIVTGDEKGAKYVLKQPFPSNTTPPFCMVYDVEVILLDSL